MIVCVKAITVRFHLNHPAEKQAWEKLNALRRERHQSFSQLVTDAVNAYGTEELHLSHTEKNEIVHDVTESVSLGLQQILPAFLAGYSSSAIVPASVNVSPANTGLPQVTPAPNDPESDDTMPDCGESCMDFDFIGGSVGASKCCIFHENCIKVMHTH